MKFKNSEEKLKKDIEILELKRYKKNNKKIMSQGNFSKRTVLFCILFTAIFALLCLYTQYKTGYETYHLLRIVAAVFGGELLMLLFKRIWASDDKKMNLLKKSSDNNSDDTLTDSENDISVNSELVSEMNTCKSEISDVTNSEIGG